ncbi:hypothetical protein DL96DRAFT_1286768 [Flagelloscypha sp. PMI_526]|nr:hypothetical protein DL96DRAFT_1286768 [Flagelloscypha sp. PMI_526]
MSASLPNELLDAIFMFSRREPELLKVCSLLDRRCAILCQAHFFAHLHLHISPDGRQDYIQKFAKLLERSPHIANLVTSVYIGREALWEVQQPAEQPEADQFSDNSSSLDSFGEGEEDIEEEQEWEWEGEDSDLLGSDLGLGPSEGAAPENSDPSDPHSAQDQGTDAFGVAFVSEPPFDTAVLEHREDHPQGAPLNTTVPDQLPLPTSPPPLPLLARVLLSLPRVTSLGIRTPYGKSSWADFFWASIDRDVLHALQTHIFPQLLTLKLHDLKGVPLRETLSLCPLLRVLSLRGVEWCSEDTFQEQISALDLSQEQNDCFIRNLSFNSYSYDSISALTDFLKSKDARLDSLSFGPSCPNDNVFTCQAVLLDAFSSKITQLSVGKKLFANFSLPASPEHYFLHRMPMLQTLTLTIELVWDMIEHTLGGINSGFKSFMVFVIDYLLSTTRPHPLSTIILEVRILKGGAIESQTSDVWKSLDETLAHNEQLKALNQVAFVVMKDMSVLSEEVCEIVVRDMSKWARGVLPICAGRQLVKTGFK